MPRQKRPGTTVRRRPPPAWKLFYQMNIPPDLRKDFSFLLHARSKSFFFGIVEHKHRKGSWGYELIERAYRLITVAYRGMYRRSGEPLREHSIRCALILMVHEDVYDPEVVAAELLHDLRETFRGKWANRISPLFTPRVGQLVDGMTKPPQNGTLRTDAEVDAAYYHDVRDWEWILVLLKAVDRLDNLMTYWRTEQTTEKKIVETETTILAEARRRQMHIASYLGKVIALLRTPAE